jgi:hypothetical protein
MDPNQALSELRAAINDYQLATDPASAADAADRLAEHSQAIDNWLCQGGFLPDHWIRPACL